MICSSQSIQKLQCILVPTLNSFIFIKFNDVMEYNAQYSIKSSTLLKNIGSLSANHITDTCCMCQLSFASVYPLEVRRLFVVMEHFVDEKTAARWGKVLMRKPMELFFLRDSLDHTSTLGSLAADWVTVPFLWFWMPPSFPQTTRTQKSWTHLKNLL